MQNPLEFYKIKMYDAKKALSLPQGTIANKCMTFHVVKHVCSLLY